MFVYNLQQVYPSEVKGLLAEEIRFPSSEKFLRNSTEVQVHKMERAYRDKKFKLDSRQELADDRGPIIRIIAIGRSIRSQHTNLQSQRPIKRRLDLAILALAVALILSLTNFWLVRFRLDEIKALLDDVRNFVSLFDSINYFGLVFSKIYAILHDPEKRNEISSSLDQYFVRDILLYQLRHLSVSRDLLTHEFLANYDDTYNKYEFVKNQSVSQLNLTAYPNCLLDIVVELKYRITLFGVHMRKCTSLDDLSKKMPGWDNPSYMLNFINLRSSQDRIMDSFFSRATRSLAIARYTMILAFCIHSILMILCVICAVDLVAIKEKLVAETVEVYCKFRTSLLMSRPLLSRVQDSLGVPELQGPLQAHVGQQRTELFR